MGETQSANAPLDTAAAAPLSDGVAPKPWDLPSAEKILRTVRDAIADPSCDSSVVLGAIAEAAHALTDASSAALAMLRNGEVVCAGRSGEMAPDLGARLSVDSGISGECLRTGKILRCDDTQKDYRADPVVCLRLGLLSIAAIPLRHEQRVVGILEAFSTRPFAFAEEHMRALQQLARLAETAYLREAGIAAQAEADSKRTALSRAWTWTRQVSAARAGFLQNKWLYVAAGVALAGVLLFFLAGRNSTTPAVSPQASAQVPVSPDASAPVAGTALTWNANGPDSLKPSPAVAGIQQAAKVEKETTTETASQPPVIQEAKGDVPSTTQSQPTTVMQAEGEPPAIIARNGDSLSLGSVLSTEATLPRLTTPISEGITEGVLIRRVQPVYPGQAIPLRLSGAVVLEATITEDGRVRDLSLIRGNRSLAQAAIDAVSQWRYTPFLLNGKAVAMKTQITVDFKAPQ